MQIVSQSNVNNYPYRRRSAYSRMEQTSAVSMATFVNILGITAILSIMFGILFLGAGMVLYYSGIYRFLAFGAYGLTFSFISLGIFSLYLRSRVIKKYS